MTVVGGYYDHYACIAAGIFYHAQKKTPSNNSGPRKLMNNRKSTSMKYSANWLIITIMMSSTIKEMLEEGSVYEHHYFATIPRYTSNEKFHLKQRRSQHLSLRTVALSSAKKRGLRFIIYVQEPRKFNCLPISWLWWHFLTVTKQSIRIARL